MQSPKAESNTSQQRQGTEYDHDEILREAEDEQQARHLISLCKSQSPIDALRAYYEDAYLMEGEEDELNRFERVMAGLLVKVIEKHIPFSLETLWSSLDPNNTFHNSKEDSFEKCSLPAFVSTIRFTNIADIKYSYTKQ